MQLTIAAIVTTQKVDGQLRYIVRSLGMPRLTASDPLLKTALQRLANEARKLLTQWVERGNSQAIASWMYDPAKSTHVFKQALTLQDKTVRIKTLLILENSPTLSVIFAPLLDNLLIQRSPSLPWLNQAAEGITAWCEKLRKKDPDIRLEDYSTVGEIWIEPIDLTLAVGAKKKKKSKGIGAILGMANPGGAESLHRVGRCLDAVSPDRCRVFGRDHEIKRLESLLASNRLQSVLLVGPSSVGKSAILEEVVRRRVLEKNSKLRHRQQVWLISPARVISGMSYLGQWEERWLSILKEARRRDHILYFDDPIGLYSAGITRDSQLCMADVLRSFMAESPIRLVFETTAEGVSILRRRDRSLVDPMVPMRIDPLDEPSSLRALNEVLIQMEAGDKCFFHPGLLPELVDHANILSPHLSLPGKIIALAHGLVADSRPGHRTAESGLSDLGLDLSEVSDEETRLSIKYELRDRGYSVTGTDLDEFVEERTGLRLGIRNQGLSLKDLREQLSHWIVGQDRAIDVLAQYAQRSLQRLQPNDKPLGVFLFLGPTGVGKTESAKALTRLLFHDESRMIRIDMNEISSASAAESLIGTFDHPDGRLPSAIRRQPNAVLLLDEIEKAHPDALDYLLQVIGEGRLTDARGRPVDFRNAFIIMTSNLGSTESTQALGYEKTSGAVAETQAAIYQRAARRFFRPEFLNRIDELVIFDRLAREHMRFIVDHHLMTLKSRDGLSRRRAFLDVKPDTVRSIIDRGYDPALGARAIKRAIEREVAQPLADQLAAIRLDAPVLIQLRCQGDRLQSESFELNVHPTAEPAMEPLLETFLETSRIELESMRESLSERSPSNAAPQRRLDQVRYYAIHSAILEAIEYRNSVAEQIKAEREAIRSPVTPIKSGSSQVVRRNYGPRDPHARLKNAALAELAIRESLASPKGATRTEPVPPAKQLQRLMSMARVMLKSADAPMAWIMRPRFLNPPGSSIQEKRGKVLYGDGKSEAGPHFAFYLLSRFEQSFQELQFTVQSVHGHHAMVVEGVGAGLIMQRLAGTYQHRLADLADRLVLFETKPIKSNDPNAWDKEIAILQGGPDAMPNDDYCGRFGWRTIRGEIGSQVTDYVSGCRVKLSANSDWVGWILDQFLEKE